MNFVENQDHDTFYRSFEDKFRGSRELIKSRLAVYLPFINPLKEIANQIRVVDLGCGRGEWLELLNKEGIEAIGIDLDEGMLEACHLLHLNVQQGEANGFLESLPDNSVSVVTSFHMVEHIPFEALQKLVLESLRVLVPGGLLIMETPNPENIQVGSHTFYYDPTHQRPIPPLLLAFLPEHYGFFRTKILRLQQDPKLEGAGSTNLIDVLAGTSPDYSVVAQKPAKAHQLATFDHAFETDHGLTLHTLASRYDTRVEASSRHAQQAIASAGNASSVAQQAIASADSASSVAQQAIASADNASSVAQQALASAENASSVAQQTIASAENASSVAQQAIASAENASSVAQQAIASADNASFVAQQAIAEATQTRELVVNLEAMLQNLQLLTTIKDQRVNDLLNSTSWRVTAPLRWLSKGMRQALAAPWRIFKFATRSLLLPPMRVVLGQPNLRQAFSTVMKRFPTVAHHLHLMAIKRGVVQAQAAPVVPAPPTEYSSESGSPLTIKSTSASDYPLTPHARRILDDLKTAIERNGQANNT